MSIVLALTAPLLGVAEAADVGDRMPSFVLPDLGGEVVRVDAGRPVVLNFWAAWCAPCREELPLFDALHRDLGADALVVTVNVDNSKRSAEAVAGKLGLTLPVLHDDGSVVASFAPMALPSTYVVGRDGRIAAVHTGALDADGVRTLGAQVRRLTGE